MVMSKSYLEQIRAHVDEDGRLNHRNAVELLAEVERLTPEQHDAHFQTWIDFWCARFERIVEFRQRQDARRGIDDETKDAADEASGIAR